MLISNHKWTIHGFLQHIGFYTPTDDLNVMRESIIIYHYEYNIVSTTPDKILHMLQDKYKININLESNFPHDQSGRDICQLKKYLEKLYANFKILLKDTTKRFTHCI